MSKPDAKATASPYVDYAHVRPDQQNTVWSYADEDSLSLVLEANRRLLIETQDQKRADLLTLAWASLAGGRT